MESLEHPSIVLQAATPIHLSKDNLRAYVACLQKQVSSITVRNRIRDLCEAVRVMDPASNLMVVRALMRRLLSS